MEKEKYFYIEEKSVCKEWCPVKTGTAIGSMNCAKCENFIESGKVEEKPFIVCEKLTE